MRFLEFKDYFEQFLVFSLRDIKKYKPDFDRRRLSEWQDKGYIKKIVRGYYVFSNEELTEELLFVIANRIYSPSYISFEMALSRYNLIPESVYGITSAVTKKTSKFDTDVAVFRYTKIKPSLMFGYRLVPYKKHIYKLADPEKVILDYLYINSHLSRKEDFFELRINKQEALELLDCDKLYRYLELFKNKQLLTRVKNFMGYLSSD